MWFWLAFEKKINLFTDQYLGQLSVGPGKNLNVIFPDTVNEIMSSFAWWYYSLSFACSHHFHWPWPNFKITSASKIFNEQFYFPVRWSWNCVRLVTTLTRSWIYHYFWCLLAFKEAKWHAFWFDKKCCVGFFSDTR